MGRTLVTPVMRTVPRDWATQLAELWPESDQTHWLRLRWEPGYAWEPVERWVIDEMIPAHLIPKQRLGDDILEQLQRDTPPQGYWDVTLGEFIREEGNLITRTAHRLFRETGCWARSWWIIQGDRGGHQRVFSESEQKLLKMARLPSAPPAAGDLPYAPFDNRVMQQLVKRDLLRDVNGQIRAHLGTKKILTLAGYRRQEHEDARAFRKLLLDWLTDQVSEVSDDLTKSLLKLDAPRRDVDETRAEAVQEASEHAFIETGRMGGLTH